jgi:hypothetical protein
VVSLHSCTVYSSTIVSLLQITWHWFVEFYSCVWQSLCGVYHIERGKAGMSLLRSDVRVVRGRGAKSAGRVGVVLWMVVL